MKFILYSSSSHTEVFLVGGQLSVRKDSETQALSIQWLCSLGSWVLCIGLAARGRDRVEKHMHFSADWSEVTPGRVEVGEGGGFTWGGVEGWGEKAYNCNWITIKIKKKKKWHTLLLTFHWWASVTRPHLGQGGRMCLCETLGNVVSVLAETS